MAKIAEYTESDQTTHFSVVDADGNAVAVTTTLNGSYGSHVTVTGAGFLMNNEMDDFSAKPGEPNMYGLIGGEANSIEPDKRMLSSMSPTIVTREGLAENGSRWKRRASHYYGRATKHPESRMCIRDGCDRSYLCSEISSSVASRSYRNRAVHSAK